MKSTTRRQFIAGSGSLVVGFSLLGDYRASAQTPEPSPLPIPTNPNFNSDQQLELSPELDSWIRIHEDSSVTFLTGRVELGNGILTAMTQIVAEELDVPFETVSLISGDTDIVPNQGITSATTTIGSSANATKRAAATARQALLDLAADELGVARDQLEVVSGVVQSVDDPSISVSYGDLVGGQLFERAVDPDVPLKSPDDYFVVGLSVPRIDIPGKLAGADLAFQEDARVEGMKFARTLRAPAFGAKLVSYDESVADLPGIVALVPFTFPGDEGLGRVERLETMAGDFIAVVGDSENQVIFALDQLDQSAEWELGEELPATSETVFDWLAETGVDLELQEDHEAIAEAYTEAIDGADMVLSATYKVPFQSYAPISPAWALADVRDDGATVWSATQWPFGTRWMVAQALGYDTDEKVRVFGGSSSGLYGRRDDYDQEVDVEAALISQAVGAPVRLQWSRQDEFGWSQYRPAQMMTLEAGLGDRGRIVGLDAKVWTAVRGVHPSTGSSIGGLAQAPYALEPFPITGHDSGPLLRTGWMRNVYRGNNIFALESFLDELAEAAGVDPVDFRINHINDPRAADVLTAAAESAGWEPHVGSSGRGIGACVALYSASTSPSSSYMAYIAEVEVDETTGEIAVKKFTCAIDCGLVINPDGVINQVEGGVIQALSWAIKEEVTFDSRMVTSRDWMTYPILTFPEVPEIETIILNRPEEPAKGIGEPVTVPVAAALTNAIYDAIGVRLRDLPLRPDRVLAEIEATRGA